MWAFSYPFFGIYLCIAFDQTLIPIYINHFDIDLDRIHNEYKLKINNFLEKSHVNTRKTMNIVLEIGAIEIGKMYIFLEILEILLNRKEFCVILIKNTCFSQHKWY